MDALKSLNCLFSGLAAIGAINWGLVGGLNFNLVAYLFGDMSSISKLVYVLVGVSGLGVLANMAKCYSNGVKPSI